MYSIEKWMKLAQGRFFSKVFNQLLSGDVKAKLSNENLSFCDFGCGLGNFSDNLRMLFPNADVSAIDYSETAIDWAKKHYPKVHFKNMDYRDMTDSYDVMITSNTLEHFSNPLEVITKLLQHTKRYFIMLVPFEESPLYWEHLFSFQKNFFDNQFENFDLIYLKALDCSGLWNTMWLGKQVVAVLKRRESGEMSKCVWGGAYFFRTLKIGSFA